MRFNMREIYSIEVCELCVFKFFQKYFVREKKFEFENNEKI